MKWKKYWWEQIKTTFLFDLICMFESICLKLTAEQVLKYSFPINYKLLLFLKCRDPNLANQPIQNVNEGQIKLEFIWSGDLMIGVPIKYSIRPLCHKLLASIHWKYSPFHSIDIHVEMSMFISCRHIDGGTHQILFRSRVATTVEISSRTTTIM